jgi:hypothetical protein
MNTPTPGPWHWVRYEGGTYACLEAADGTDVIRRVRDDAGFMDIGVPNSADAALIASAPALLAAAEQTLHALGPFSHPQAQRARRALRAAIAQPRGEPS